MPIFETILESKNGENYKTATSSTFNKSNSYETNPIMSIYEIKTDNESKACILTQEEVNEQIKKYISRLAKHLEDLIRLIQAMYTAH